ncbi:hypothetical protein HQ584_08870, partial [Patescibacteria group bacterium]|nr:hypothetical protein [Patescibacteria group bacterium]
EENIPRFLFGDGKDEPPLDVLAEEVDLLPLKVRFREMCRKGNENGHRPDLLMVSDFGQMSIVQLKRYSQDPGLSLGYTISDERLHKIIFNKFNEDDSEKAGVLGESLEALFHNQITEGELTNILKLIKENGLEKAFGEIRSTYHGSIDRALETALEGAESGSREDMVEFIKLLCGSEALQDQFLGWLEQRGEQMCASLPQLPSIVRISSGIGVVHLINSLLGRPVPDRAIYDIQNIKAIEG